MEGIEIEKLILNEDNLKSYGILKDYNLHRSRLYRAHKRENCILIQGASFVVKNKAFLIMGVGGIDFLDSLMRLTDVDGIIGNGNTLFISRDFKYVYSAHTKDELIRCYELEGFENNATFLESAPIAPLILLLRSFRNFDEYNATKNKVGNVIFEVVYTFAGKPIRFAGSLKSRLRQKFIATARVVHCARRPTLMKKECLFDSHKAVRDVIDNFNGKFLLVYTLWNQVLCDAIGMRKTRDILKEYNHIDLITPHFIECARSIL